MFCSKTPRTLLQVVSGHLSMLITLHLLLSLHLSLAYTLQPDHRRQGDAWVSEQRLPRAGEPSLSLPGPNVVPFINTEAAPQRIAQKARPKRAPQRGCQLGTCQLHNLADTLYQMGKTNGKDQSQRAHDPQGYGR